MYLIENTGCKDNYFFANIGYVQLTRSQLKTFNNLSPTPTSRFNWRGLWHNTWYAHWE